MTLAVPCTCTDPAGHPRPMVLGQPGHCTCGRDLVVRGATVRDTDAVALRRLDNAILGVQAGLRRAAMLGGVTEFDRWTGEPADPHAYRRFLLQR